MANAKVVKKNNAGTIAQNKRARHDYFIEEKFEAGLSLQGWEVKSLRAGRMSLVESYITFKNNEAFLFGAQIQPLLSASTHVACYWKGHLAKLEIALVKGKQLHDKRQTEKDRDWQRDKARLFHQ